MHSFPNMPNTIGSKMHGLAVRFLLTKKCLKNSFLKWHKSWSPEYVGAWLPQFLRFSTFSGVFLKIWDISFQMGHRHPFLDQNCPIGGHLNFFTKWHKKWKKTPFLFFFFSNLLEFFGIYTHIQGTTMWKLTSWGFRKGGTFWACKLSNGSYCCSKSAEGGKSGCVPENRQCQKQKKHGHNFHF